MRQPEIGVDHADQRQAGKVAFGDELRSTMSASPLAIARAPPSPLHALGVSLDGTSVRAAGKRSSLLLKALHPGPQATRLSSALQFRAASGRRSQPQWWQASVRRSDGRQPGGAVRARHSVAAGAAN
jgi:hypothetical protein